MTPCIIILDLTLTRHFTAKDLVVSSASPLDLALVVIANHPAKHWKLKHIDTRYHFVRDHVQEGEVKIDFVRTTDNVADILTKLLKGLATSRIACLMGLTMPSRGGVEDVSAS
ncbi:uncharacterized protein UDID_17774 [Ustilago sp. UG-2017a]|nr:uncharacterized protein UDID_17774 [Ustilago sp. UG-2017a]